MNKLLRLFLRISTGMILMGQTGPVHATDIQPDPLLLNNQSISAGENHTCGVTGDGKVRCWGDNQYGQLGDGTRIDRKTPIYVSNLKGVTAVSVGRFHSCALLSTGGVKCWGANGDGQLGDGTNDRRLTPVSVSNLASGVTAISAGSYHTCALTSIGGMKCWGNNYDGQVGDDTTTDRNEPVTVFLTGIMGISTGWAHTCAVTTANGAKCWGNNIHGQLGNGTTDEQHAPVGVSGLNSGVTSISAGGFHSCAVVDAGIKCWGWNYYGQLGDTHTGEQHSPVNVFWLGAVPTAVSAGGNHTCALDSDSGARCWGWNAYGQLGDNSTTQRTAPVPVSGLASGVGMITTGHISSCALLDVGGGIKCWGYNSDGQLGDGTLTNRDEPTSVISPRLTFRSGATRDGWILESGENSDLGGSINTDRNIVVGDNATDKQYRSILHFNTSTLADNATIIRVELKIRLNSIVGTDPLTTHGLLQADIMEGTFGDADLEITDFEAPASRLNIGHFGLIPGSLDWYRLVLGSSNFGFINLTGPTQFRIYFATGDDDDNNADQLKFFSGDEVEISSRPQLIIEYVLP